MTKQDFNNQLIELQERLYFFAVSLTADTEEARDLVQETYLKAFTNCCKFDDTTNLKAWAYTIMKNTFINNYRRSVRQNMLFDYIDDTVFLSQNRDAYSIEPDSELRRKEIVGVIEQLENGFKEPFEMRMQGYKYKEIAETLGMKIGTVKSRIFFTRKKLCTILSDYGQEDYN